MALLRCAVGKPYLSRDIAVVKRWAWIWWYTRVVNDLGKEIVSLFVIDVELSAQYTIYSTDETTQFHTYGRVTSI